MKCKYCDGEAKRHGTRKHKNRLERAQVWRCSSCKKYTTYGYRYPPIERGLFFDFSLGYVIGVLVGDGSLENNQDYYYFNDKFQHVKKVEATMIVPRTRYAFQLNVKDKEFAEEYAKHLGKILGRSIKVKPSTRTADSIAGNPTPGYVFHGWRLHVRSKEWYRKLKPLKDNLEWIKKAPKEVKRGFLRGIYDSEGHAHEEKYSTRIVISNVNHNLLQICVNLLKSFGIKPPKIREKPNGPNTIFVLGFGNKHSTDLFYKEIDFTIKRKKKGNLKYYG